VYLAPTLLGPGQGMANVGPLASLANATPLEFTSVERVGSDLRLVVRPPGRADF
jgi:diaminohydroxyphosphoribosylaminopyrimidine deaminase / 5-amino-6-(5-phosphoribosylamino)uracil reductase